MPTTIAYAGDEITLPDWPGTEHEGSHFILEEPIAGRSSIGYGRASQNHKQGQGFQDSADEQAHQYTLFCHRFRTIDRGVYLDPSASAGISATKAREYFGQALDRIRDDPGIDVLWAMTSSRLGRGQIRFEDFMTTLMTRGILLAVGDSLYNPACEDDEIKLFSMYSSDRTGTHPGKKASKRGLARALREGRPLGRPPYGLRRDRNQVPPWDVPDTDRPDGQPDPADVVTEIFQRIIAGDRGSVIAADLEARQVLMPWAAAGLSYAKARRGPFAWSGTAVEKIAANPAYAALRQTRGRVLGQADGGLLGQPHGRILDDVEPHIKALISKDDYWLARQAMASRRKVRDRPPRRPEPSMLAGTARAACGGPLSTGGGTGRYSCNWDACASIRLSNPLTAGQLAAPGEEDAARAAKANAEVARLQAEIDQLNAMRRRPGAANHPALVESIMLLEHEQDEALQQAESARMPRWLDDLLGPDAGEKWHKISPQDKRRAVSRIITVTLLPTPEGWPRNLGLQAGLPARVRLACKIPGTTTWPEPAGQQPWVPASAERGSRIAAWLAEQDGPRPMAQIAAGTGMPVWMAQRAVRPLMEDGQLARKRGTGEHWNTWYYQVREGR
jgi:DNA invertase Pin-like site-specific DNA recombinase